MTWSTYEKSPPGTRKLINAYIKKNRIKPTTAFTIIVLPCFIFAASPFELAYIIPPHVIPPTTAIPTPTARKFMICSSRLMIGLPPLSSQLMRLVLIFAHPTAPLPPATGTSFSNGELFGPAVPPLLLMNVRQQVVYLSVFLGAPHLSSSLSPRLLAHCAAPSADEPEHFFCINFCQVVGSAAETDVGIAVAAEKTNPKLSTKKSAKRTRFIVCIFFILIVYRYVTAYIHDSQVDVGAAFFILLLLFCLF
jgi:hypothetical protein